MLLAQQTLPGDIAFPDIPWWDLSPMLALIVGALLLMIIGALTPTWRWGGYAWFTSVTAAVAGGLAIWRWTRLDATPPVDADGLPIGEAGSRIIVAGALAYDHLAIFLTISICISVILVALLTDGVLEREGRQTLEPYALFMVAAAGAIVMASANDLIVLFLGLETLSLALYVLAASDRSRRASQEAGFKYFILGGFASAFFLYGIALIYGSIGSTNLAAVSSRYLATVPLEVRDPFILLGTALMLVGLAFKIAAAPFHFWQPDVYEGSPSNVTGFMASVGKVGAFAAVVRVLIIALPYGTDDWRPVLWALAVASLVVGALLAVVQTNVKRMLAYSSINHAGFMLVAAVAAGYTAGRPASAAGGGMPALVAYLALYSVLVIGSFGVVALVSQSRDGDTSLEAFAGIGRRRPVLSLILSVFLLAQAGVPFTSGFIAKFGAIRAAVEQGSYALAIIAMVSAVVAAFLYLRIMVSVWFRDAEGATTDVAVPVTAWISLGVAALATIVIGIFPGPVLDWAGTVTDYVVR